MMSRWRRQYRSPLGFLWHLRTELQSRGWSHTLLWRADWTRSRTEGRVGFLTSCFPSQQQPPIDPPPLGQQRQPIYQPHYQHPTPSSLYPNMNGELFGRIVERRLADAERVIQKELEDLFSKAQSNYRRGVKKQLDFQFEISSSQHVRGECDFILGSGASVRKCHKKPKGDRYCRHHLLIAKSWS